MSDEESTAEDDVYSRDIEGRGHGDGRWLEFQLSRALKQWGYITDMRETAYGLEIDVVAKRKEPRDRPTDWIVAECKDWENRSITPNVIYRLCMLAFSCRAMPVLCHTTSLTPKAREIARKWEVRVLTIEDLHRGSLPAPNVSAPITELCMHRRQYTPREGRGTLPVMLTYERDLHFSYVPGFKAKGRLCEYQPIEDADESHSSEESGE